MLNIRELAQKLGVSAATVSLALNHKKGVNPQLAEKIRNQAFVLGYHKGLQQPKANYSITVTVLQVIKHGHILGAHHQSFIDSYIMGMMQYAMESNVKLEIKTIYCDKLTCFSNPPSSKMPLQTKSQGYIILATELEAKEVEVLNEKLAAPAVFIDAIYDELPFDFIDMNNTDVLFEVVKHLASQGCQTISFVGSKQNTPNFYMRELAVEMACDKLGLDLKCRYSIEPYDDPDALEMQKSLSKNPPPEALICANDFIAYNCIKALSALNYQIPQDVAVVGFDNLPASPLFLPPLSSVEVPKQEIGILALARLLDKLSGQPFSQARTTVKQSTRPLLRFLSPCKQKLSCHFIPRASSTRH